MLAQEPPAGLAGDEAFAAGRALVSSPAVLAREPAAGLADEEADRHR